jgi:hypothetical protein
LKSNVVPFRFFDRFLHIAARFDEFLSIFVNFLLLATQTPLVNVLCLVNVENFVLFVFSLDLAKGTAHHLAIATVQLQFLTVLVTF